MSEIEKLEPCPNPWCEADEREGDFRPQVQHSNFALVYVACTSCGMAGPTRQHEAEAIAAWNRRPSTPAAGDVEAVLRKAARWVQNRADVRFSENGTREWDTNATCYEGAAGEIYEALDEEDEEIASYLRKQADALLARATEGAASPSGVVEAQLFKAIAYVHANGGGVALPTAVDLMDPVHQGDLDRLHEYVSDIVAALATNEGDGG